MTKLTAKARSDYRDSLARQVALICAADLSRQISAGSVMIDHTPIATRQIAIFSYQLAEDMLEARDRK